MDPSLTGKTSLLNANSFNQVFTIGFDFTTADQKAILRYLQDNNYSLFAYKGASGSNQVSAGLPTWFVYPYSEMFGTVEIDYDPLYKVYVFNKAIIDNRTTIRMEALSGEIELGTAVQFNPDGSFSISGPASPRSIAVFNNRPGGTNNITVGLAAKINGQYIPFCAFTSISQGSVSMQPNEKVCLFAAQAYLAAGSVTDYTRAPGCTFEFNPPGSTSYKLQMVPSTLGITNAPGGLPVTLTNSGQSLVQLLNTP